MATIKLGTTKAASKLINYAEKRAEVKDGFNADPDYAKSQMRMTREMFSKNDGVQAHHVIQSFKPDEVTPEKANQMGVELAERVAPGHEVAVYTHADTDHVHNHLVVNSVHTETGKKYQAHGNRAIEQIRRASDAICKQHGLSIVKEKKACVRHTLAEQQLLEKGQVSWKDEIRQAVNETKQETSDWDSFKSDLKEQHGVEMKLRGNTLSYKHPEQQRFVRANKLGHDYDVGGLEREFARKATQKKGRIDWNEHEQRRQLQRQNGSDRAPERAYGTTYRPVSGKYRREQQQRQQEHAERLAAEREKQQRIKKANQRARNQSKGLGR